MEKLIDQLKGLTTRIKSLKESIETEEATKTAIIMPFFQILGYDVFNPLEFSPEFTADVGIKKGEKVDYAILKDGLPVILIECKSLNEQLKNHDSQLFRYFGTTTAKFGILTNGIEYRFYTDLEEPNKMDTTPFFSFNILELRESHINEIAKFRKEAFDLERISSTASDLKYLGALKSYLAVQFEKPDEEFIKFLVQQIYDGIRTKSILEKFEPIIMKGLNQIINEKVNDKLNAALKSTGDNKEQNSTELSEMKKLDTFQSNNDEIITTPEELESYSVVKVILKDTIAPERVFYRDNLSYFNILIDDNIRKWIIRVFFTESRNYIVLNDANKDKDRTVIDFEQPIDLIKFKDKIVEVAQQFE